MRLSHPCSSSCRPSVPARGRVLRSLGFGFAFGLGAALPGQPALQWEATELRIQAAPGDTQVGLAFRFANRSADEVVIREIKPSCGCTTLNLPSLPWTVQPGEAGVIEGRVNLQGKHGLLKKNITLQTSHGSESLVCLVTVPEVLGEQREQNILRARADRQAVFQGECAACHVAPAKGLEGGALYVAACAICHASEHRASMVPELFAPGMEKTSAEWEAWIRTGRDGTLMPAFARAAGGPLDDAQIQTLVRYLVIRQAATAPWND